MKKKRGNGAIAWLLIMALLLSLAGCNTPGDEGSSENYESYESTTESVQTAFDEFLDQVFREEIVLNTLNLHYLLKEPENFGIEEYEISLGEASLESLQESCKEARTLLSEMRAFDYALLSPEQQLTYDVLEDYLGTSLESEPYALYMEELSPTIGTQTQLPILLAEYIFYDEQDVKDYLALLTLVPGYYQQLIEFEQHKSTNGLFMSDRAVDDLVESCQAFLADQENHYLILTFDERIDALEGLTDDQRESYKTQNRDIFTQQIAPAYQALIDGLTALKGTGQYEGGLANYPDGKAYYEYLVKMGTGTGHTVDELKTLIDERMNAQLLEMSLRIQSSSSAMAGLMNFQFTLTDPEEILQDLKGKLSEDFPAIPETTYTIKTVPTSLEDTMSPAFYLTPPLDAPYDNVIYINNSQLDETTLYSTLAHEGYPGHLYQSVYAATLERHPLLGLTSCSGYSEGWATYVEYYAYTLDDEVSTNVAKVMALNSSITLGVYAMVDIGVNYDGWTVAQTQEYLAQWFGELDQETVELFYYSMVEAPGNYLNYYVGYLEILLLREEAEELLDDAFVLKDFHTFILDMSDCSFRVIDKYFDTWIAERMPASELPEAA